MKPTCDICNVEMKFKERIKSNKTYRIRRFECSVCGNIQTIYADGYFDLKVCPESAVKKSKKMFKQEQENRTYETNKSNV